jgi:hypothetical protein
MLRLVTADVSRFAPRWYVVCRFLTHETRCVVMRPCRPAKVMPSAAVPLDLVRSQTAEMDLSPGPEALFWVMFGLVVLVVGVGWFRDEESGTECVSDVGWFEHLMKHGRQAGCQDDGEI